MGARSRPRQPAVEEELMVADNIKTYEIEGGEGQDEEESPGESSSGSDPGSEGDDDDLLLSSDDLDEKLGLTGGPASEGRAGGSKVRMHG